jgi:hypothetical protein
MLPPTIVSRGFYTAVTKMFPIIRDNPSYARLLGHLLFSDFLDEETHYTVCPESLLAEMENMGHKLQGKNRNYNRANKFVEEFQGDLGIELLKQSSFYREGRATSYQLPQFDAEFQRILQFEITTSVILLSDGICLDTGEVYSAKVFARYEKELEEERRSKIPSGREDIDFLNKTLLETKFLKRNIEAKRNEALSAALLLPTSVKRKRAGKIINSGFASSPLYIPAKVSERIYTMNPSIQNLPSDLRKIILSPSISYDLAAAQLAIMGRLWEISEVQHLLERGNPWQEICTSLGLGIERKGLVKPLVYSTAFGMGQKRLGAKYAVAMGYESPDKPHNKIPEEKREEYYQELTENKFMEALLDGRRKALKRIKEAKGVVNANGVFRPLSFFPSSSEGGSKSRSMLAYEMQSYEVDLMQPVIEIARENKSKMMISGWIHDGVYLHYYKPDRYKKLEKEIIHRVNIKAESLGFLTKLEREAS